MVKNEAFLSREDFSSVYAKIVTQSPSRRITLPVVQKMVAAMFANPVFRPE